MPLTVTKTSCWLDLTDQVNLLCQCRQLKHNVTELCDYKAGLSGSAKEQLKCLETLKAHGVRVRVVQGHSLGPAYKEAGRKAPGGRGLMHAKCLLVGGLVIIGSANWTTSSKCNWEVGVLVRLTPRGFHRLYEVFRKIDLAGEDLTEEFVSEAEKRKESRGRSLSRTASPPRSRSRPRSVPRY